MKRIEFNKTTNAASFKRIEFEAELSVEGTRVRGYATKWNKLSGDRGGFLALFPPGSMRLPTYEITCQYNHDDNWLLASENAEACPLVVGEDDMGVPIEAVLGDTFLDHYVVSKIKAGVIKGMSLGMYALKLHREERVVTAEDAAENAELLPLVGQTVEVEVYDEWLLDEVTITGRPALPQTSVEIATKRPSMSAMFAKEEEAVEEAPARDKPEEVPSASSEESVVEQAPALKSDVDDLELESGHFADEASSVEDVEEVELESVESEEFADEEELPELESEASDVEDLELESGESDAA